MRSQVEIEARGHAAVQAAHGSTFEVTTDDYLTDSGDCIIAVEADCAPRDYDAAFTERCSRPGATIMITIETPGFQEVVTARGSDDLTFASDRSAVVRTSTYVDDRTVAIGADHAAADLDRDMVAALADGASASITLEVE